MRCERLSLRPPLAAAGRRPPMPGLRPYAVVGDAIPALPHRRAGRPGAWPGHRRRPAGRALPALPCRPVPGGALPGRPGARPRRRRAPACPRASSGCAWSTAAGSTPTTIMPSYYRIDGLEPRRLGVAGPARADRPGDRGCRGVPRHLARTDRRSPAAAPLGARRRCRRPAPARPAGAGHARGDERGDPRRFTGRAPGPARAASASTCRPWSRTATPCPSPSRSTAR